MLESIHCMLLHFYKAPLYGLQLHIIIMFSLELTMESSLFWRTGLADLAVKETTLTLGLSLYIYQ